jgi:hypothetical protein
MTEHNPVLDRAVLWAMVLGFGSFTLAIWLSLKCYRLNEITEMLAVASTIFISGIIYVASGVSSIKFVKGAHGPLCLMVLILSTARMLIISAVAVLWYIQQSY